MKTTIKHSQEELGFRLRGLENTRLESLSDGVFAIAIGLLLLSSSPPKTFDDLRDFIRDFVPFAGSIAILMMIWYQHYLYFIRFGLRDAGTVTINTILLFLVLFYTYPLRFLFRLIIDIYTGLLTGNREMTDRLFSETIRLEDTSELMVIYGLGASAIFFVFVWLSVRALRRKEALELSPLEVFLTKNNIRMNLVIGLIPLLSVTIAYFQLGGKNTFILSGFSYMLYLIIMPIVGYSNDKKLERFKAGL